MDRIKEGLSHSFSFHELSFNISLVQITIRAMRINGTVLDLKKFTGTFSEMMYSVNDKASNTDAYEKCKGSFNE